MRLALTAGTVPLMASTKNVDVASTGLTEQAESRQADAGLHPASTSRMLEEQDATPHSSRGHE